MSPARGSTVPNRESGLTPEIAAAVRAALGDPRATIVAIEPVSGGCISHANRVTTSAGEIFLKWNASCPPDLFEREADGLRALAGAGGEVVIPRVFGARSPRDGCPALIVMEYLRSPGGAADDDHHARLGRGLAVIHRTTAAAFGFGSTTYCGATDQDNRWHEDWIEFFAQQRIGRLLEHIARRRRPGTSWRHALDRFVDRLPTLVSHRPRPSLIHGDLWSGNVLRSEKGPALIDPACAYADREMEMGIATMFGGFPARFWDAYQDTWPLPAGWRERNPVYQLYHILNHYYLFGGHYGADARRVADAFA